MTTPVLPPAWVMRTDEPIVSNLAAVLLIFTMFAPSMVNGVLVLTDWTLTVSEPAAVIVDMAFVPLCVIPVTVKAWFGGGAVFVSVIKPAVLFVPLKLPTADVSAVPP